MNTLLIGHTQGIGKRIYEIFPNIDGLSRSNGFNINKPFPINLLKYNRIILNAYGNFTSQLKLLYEIIENPTYQKDTLLFIIGSIKAYSSYSKDINRSKYHIEKQALLNASIDLRELGYNIIILNPSYINTEYNKDKNIRKMSDYMPGEMILMISDYYKKNGLLISNLTFEQK